MRIHDLTSSFKLCGQSFLIAWPMCLFFSSSMFPYSVNPFEYMIFGRMAFLFSGSLGMFLTMIFSEKITRVIDRPLFIFGSAALASFGSAIAAIAPLAVGFEQILIIGGFFLAGFGNTALFLSFAAIYSKKDMSISSKVLPLSTVLAGVIFLIAANLMGMASTLVTITFPLVSATWLHIMWQNESKALQKATRNDGEEDIPSERKPFKKWGTTINTAGFWLAFGVMWTLSIQFFSDNVTAWNALSLPVSILVVTVSFVLIFIKHKLNQLHAVWLVIPVMVVGVSLAVFFGSDLLVFAFALMFSARIIAETELITHFVTISKKNELQSILLFGRGFFVLSLGELAGTIIGALIASFQTAAFLFVLLLVVNLFVIVLVLSIIRVNKELSLQVQEDASRGQEADSRFLQPKDSVMKDFGDKHSLSKREVEVLEYLLAGRNTPYIAEKLTISRSTVHTHIKHIYEKTGVHARQDLLDLIEEEAF